MFWKILGVIGLLIIIGIVLIAIFAIKEFFSYMIGDDEEEDGYYDQEIAAINQEKK